MPAMRQLPARYLLPSLLAWIAFTCVWGVAFKVGPKSYRPSLWEVAAYLGCSIIVLWTCFAIFVWMERRINKKSK